MELQTMTPDEMLDGAIARMTKIAEWHLKAFPRLSLKIGNLYEFPFDKKAVYKYNGPSILIVINGVTFEQGFFHYFQRMSDGAIMKATKYSDSPEEI